MIYEFTHLKITYNGYQAADMKQYDPFRKNGKENLNQKSFADQRIDIFQTDILPHRSKKTLVYNNYPGISVFMDAGIEYRYFYDLFTGQDYACLKIPDILQYDGTKLYLQKQYLQKHNLSEQQILNCLAVERICMAENRLILHSSFIDTGNGALLFSAPSGTGKSTQAELWRKYRRSRIINGDRSAIWKENGKWLAGGVPWCGTSGIMKNEVLPLKAIILLAQKPKNEVMKPRLIEKVKRLVEQTTINPWNRKMLHWAETLITELCSEILVLQLNCRPDEEAVNILDQYLLNML